LNSAFPFAFKALLGFFDGSAKERRKNHLLSKHLLDFCGFFLKNLVVRVKGYSCLVIYSIL
jgi:hypothetical protein